MNKITYCLLFFSVFGFSQNITFNDPDLLTYLTTKLCVDTNGDGIYDSTADFNNDNQIQLSEAQQVTRFKFSTLAHFIEDLGGFENFSNLEVLEVTTIRVTEMDFSIWPALKTLKLSSIIESFTFDNPLLTHFYLQNVGFNNPLFDLTNLPNLEYVKVQSSHLTDNLIFGIHNNLEELSISGESFSSLNLSGMPALKILSIDNFIGTTLDISNNTLLEEFWFNYNENLNSIVGVDASIFLEDITLVQGDRNNSPSNLDLVFNNPGLRYLELRGMKSIGINNAPNLVQVELWNIEDSVTFNNCVFNYVNDYYDRRLFIGEVNSDAISFSNVEGLKSLTFQSLNTDFPFPLDLSTTFTETLGFSGSSLSELNLKNGDTLQQFNSSYDTDIQFICIDSEEMNIVESGYQNPDFPVVIHPYCTFVLGGDYYEITGNILVDLGAGCLSYTAGSIFDVRFTVSDSINSDSFFANNLNEYSYTLPEGNHTFSSELVESDYWTIDPSSIDLNFPEDGSPYVQDFCITPNGVRNDLEITIIPLVAARPGFETNYKIIYKNKGNTTLSGNIDFIYDDNYMDLLTSNPIPDSQATGNLMWNFSTLQPFETRELSLTMTLNAPTDPDFPLNAGDLLTFSATINPIAADETPDDNVIILNQELVNSLDPNDKTCLEGEMITPEQVGKYIHYLIRFENTGSANAVNVVVKDVIDTTKYDLSSLIPLHASHDFYTRIKNENEVEFIFENIELPFDDANNDGYVLFKIKTLPTLNIGDSFSNIAIIYFDYNAPIVTNNETTIVQEDLSTSDFKLMNVKVYPNPTTDYFKIDNPSGLDIKAIELYHISGKKIKQYSTSEIYEVNDLSSGVYFIKIKTAQTETNIKLIKV